jgi:hypothetical protein
MIMNTAQNHTRSFLIQLTFLLKFISQLGCEDREGEEELMGTEEVLNEGDCSWSEVPVLPSLVKELRPCPLKD